MFARLSLGGASKTSEHERRAVRELTAVGNRLFFRADDEIHGAELWTLEINRTTPVSRFWEWGTAGSSPVAPEHLTVYTVYFVVRI